MNMQTILNRKIAYGIDFVKAETSQDFEYIRACCQAEDFKSSITEDIDDNADYFIIQHQGQNLGICNLKMSEQFGVKSATPNLYMSRKKSINTLRTMKSLVYFLFEICQIDRMEIRVFSSNKQMLSIISSSLFIYEGCLKYCKKLGDIYVDIYYYSFLKREYDAYLE